MSAEEDYQARLREHVQRTVADAPPLTADQRDRLAALLQPFVDTAEPSNTANKE